MALLARITGVVVAENTREGKSDDGRTWQRSTVTVLTGAGQTEFTYPAEGSFSLGQNVDVLVSLDSYNNRLQVSLVDNWNVNGLEELRFALEAASLASAATA